MKGRSLLLNAGALVSALGVFMSWCCLLPVVLGTAGAGLAALGSRFEPYRPWLTTSALVFLGLAIFQAYRPGSRCATGETCPAPASRRRQRFFLWAVFVLTLSLLAFPYLAGLYYYLQ